MKTPILLGALLLLATAFAGCTGDFNIKQTEPIRIQIDGAGESSRMSATGGAGSTEARESEFRLDTGDDVDHVTVVVQVTKVESDDDAPATTTVTANQTSNETSSKPAIILVIIEDRDSGKRLAEKRVECEDADDPASAEIDVDVKGKNNVVIITQAVQGTADVNVAAQSAGQSVDQDSDATASPTTTASTTTTYQP